MSKSFDCLKPDARIIKAIQEQNEILIEIKALLESLNIYWQRYENRSH